MKLASWCSEQVGGRAGKMECNGQRARGLVAAAYLVAVGFLAAGAGPARATISYGETDLALATPDYSTSFDGSSLADSDLITSQFSGDGFTFSGGIRFRNEVEDGS